MKAPSNPLHQLFDWKQFELFVKDIYATDPSVLVEHDVTEYGKSGASRQIDVKVTQNSPFHTYVTIIECKFWNKSIERTTVDIVAASIEDLNASKGVIFTTVGYQEGAEKYAKSKNIDIFVVRELFDEDWGAPGRKVKLYLDIVSGQMSRVVFPNAQALMIVEEHPEQMDLAIELKKENILDIKFDLYSSRNGDKGCNLVEVLAQIHQWVTKTVHFNLKEKDQSVEDNLVIMTDVSVDMSNYEFRQLRNKYSAVNLREMEMNFVTQISHSELNFDRFDGMDYALVVQNYITDKRFYASKRKDESAPQVTKYQAQNYGPEDKFVNGSTATVFCSQWVGVEVDKANRVGKTDLIKLKVEKSETGDAFRITQILGTKS